MNYYKQMQATIDFIEAHLTEELSPASIAEQAHFSVTHFYRIFRALVGESVIDYIRKRRLSQSAIELLDGKRRTIEIAVKYGFESQETYIRAFNKQFGTTPGRYKKAQDRIILYEKANPVQLPDKSQTGSPAFAVQSRIIYRKALQVVGLQAMVKPGSASIKELWAAFGQRRSGIGGQTRADTSIGVCEYYPDITDECDFSYIACAEVAGCTEAPPGMINRTIPSSKYAVFSHPEGVHRLRDIYDYIYGGWLPDSGYELAEQDTLECYGPLTGGADGGLQVLIPVK